jgi:hypothetical protein
MFPPHRTPPSRVPPGVRIWQCSDPEPKDRPNVISLSKVKFHWDETDLGWYRCDEELSSGRRTLFPWVYLIESMCLVSADTSNCHHTAKKIEGEPA